MAELAVVVVVFGALVYKFAKLRVVHLEWGLLRLEFEPSKSKSQPKPVKQPKQIRM